MRYTKKQVKEILDYVNRRLGSNYSTDYHSGYGGWNMYIVDKEHGHRHLRGVFGFDCRKSTKEFVAYLQGIICAIDAHKTTW